MRRMDFPERTAGDYFGELIGLARERAGHGYGSDARRSQRAHQAARRQAFFERADDKWWAMLPYRRLREFEGALDPGSVSVREDLCREVIRAVSMYEGMDNEERAGNALWLATSEGDLGQFASFRRFPLNEFELRVARAEAPYVETRPDHLELVHLRSGAKLDLDLDLLELLERLGEGHMPSAEEGRGFLLNLALFKYRLLAEPASELILLANEELMRIAVGTAPGSVTLSQERA